MADKRKAEARRAKREEALRSDSAQPQNTRKPGPGTIDSPGQFQPNVVDTRALKTYPSDNAGHNDERAVGPQAMKDDSVGSRALAPSSLNATHFPTIEGRGKSLPGEVKAGWGQLDGRPSSYPPDDHGHPGKADSVHYHSQYANNSHPHPGKADNPHGNGQHFENYALAGHNHSQSVKLMSQERRRAAVELRERIRKAPTPQDLADGLLFVMGLLFDDAEEPLEDTLGRTAAEQMARHIEQSAGVEVEEAEPMPEHPHPDLDRIADG